MVLAYEGTNYAGFQLQKNGPTVQGELETALQRITCESVTIYGAGRTDAGVHASGQVVNFLTHTKIPVEQLPKAFNSVLPADILVKSVCEVPVNFHARYSAQSKTYIYRIYSGVQRPLFERHFVYHYRHSLEVGLMREIIPFILGQHDFKSFQASGSTVKSTVRTVNYCKLGIHGQEIQLIINADGFLYHMVRNIVGTLILLGVGKLSRQDFQHIMTAKSRTLAGPTVPAQGLCLAEVIY